MGKLLEKRWVCILLSVLLAIAFWAYVRAAVDPNGTTNIHNVRVETTGTGVLASQGLAVAEISPQIVEVEVEGPNSARTNLLRNRNGLYVRVDVSSCVEGENTLRYKPVWPENINTDDLKYQSGTVTVKVEKLYTRTFDVEFRLDGRVAENYQMGTPAIEPEQVIASGPVEQVNQVAAVSAVLKDEELSERFAGDLPLTPVDKAGKPLEGLEITLSAETAYVVVPVVKTKEVSLTVDLRPGGGATAEDAKCVIDPAKIVVSGSEADLEGLEEISLGSVNLSDVVGTKDFPFPVALDPSLTNESGLTTATVTVTVEGLDTQVFEVSNIRLINVPEGYTPDIVTQSVLVTVRGPAEELARIDASQLQVVADPSGIPTLGNIRVPARVYLNGTSTVGVIGEYTISVNMSR